LLTCSDRYRSRGPHRALVDGMGYRRSVVYLIIALSLLAGLATGRPFFFTVAYTFIGLLAFAFLWARGGVSGLHASRRTQSRHAQVGGHVEEVLTLRNVSLLPKLWVEVYDRSDLIGHRASHVIGSLRPHAQVSWRVRTFCVQRGVYRLGPLRVVAGDPFGLFQVERQMNVTLPLIVYPPTVKLADFTLLPGPLPGGETLRRRAHYITPNAASVRDYAPGDSLNRIHWLSTARKGRLMVKEFELDPLGDIWVFLDVERAVHVGEYAPTEAEVEPTEGRNRDRFAIPPTTEEYAVAAAASLVSHFLQRGRTVGLVAHGQRLDIVPADRGAHQLARILEVLAAVEARGTRTFDQLLMLHTSHLARGTAVILITPSMRESWVRAAHVLARRGLRPTAVLIDPASFGGRPGAETLVTQLAAADIPVYRLKLGDDLRRSLSQRYG